MISESLCKNFWLLNFWNTRLLLDLLICERCTAALIICDMWSFLTVAESSKVWAIDKFLENPKSNKNKREIDNRDVRVSSSFSVSAAAISVVTAFGSFWSSAFAFLLESSCRKIDWNLKKRLHLTSEFFFRWIEWVSR